MQMMTIRYIPGRANFVGRPFARSPIENFSLINEIAHRPDSFFNRRIRIGTVTEQ